MPASKKQLDYIATYNKEHLRQFNFSASLERDADIISRLDSVPSKAAYLKRLIREDIARERMSQGIPARISLDGGAHFLSVEEAMAIIGSRGIWTDVLSAMDPQIMVQLAGKIPDTREDFLRLYLSLAPSDLILG